MTPEINLAFIFSLVLGIIITINGYVTCFIILYNELINFDSITYLHLSKILPKPGFVLSLLQPIECVSFFTILSISF